jgi:putative membrane protein
VTRVSTRRRWPGWVYDQGEEPDVRFTLANERTFLAWIRTALALLAAGVALDAFDVGLPTPAQGVLTVTLVSLGLVSAVAAWFRWARAERALRLDEPLPALPFAAVLAAGIVAVAFVVLVAR